MRVAFYGVRGSRPVSSERFTTFGGNSSCIGVSLGELNVVLDAGSGIANIPRALWKGKETHVFLSHLHHDHIAGLMFYGALYEEDCKVTIHLPLEVEKGPLEAYWRPPYFPIPLGSTKAPVRLQKAQESKAISAMGHMAGQACGSMVVDAMYMGKHVHPSSGVTAYRISDGRSALVYATDVELADDASKQAIADFAKGVDILILDAHFTDEEYQTYSGWGHNSVDMAIQVGAMSQCRRLILFHHHPHRDDEQMIQLEASAVKRFANARAAREGEVVYL